VKGNNPAQNTETIKVWYLPENKNTDAYNSAQGRGDNITEKLPLKCGGGDSRSKMEALPIK